ncbi:Myosin-10-like isoform X17 [Oopsacas minuta]|uniref:Myosin-10-like isoform X17 n=1 Tax=Oopsacas minuta TaxID=111878 RepID=A0AAV7JK54_9METZ|nr:Myosin-10-like isoform X17 [Oopsacas minuta]
MAKRSKIPTLTTSPRSGNVPGDEMSLINECFMTDGLALSATDELKLKHLWRKLKRTEDTLKGAVNESATLREQTKDEMAAVESYVAHIRNLSEQRDKLSRELEIENDAIKQQIIQTDAEKDALYDEVRSARRLLITEGHQHLSGAGVQEMVTFFIKEKQKIQTELNRQERKVTNLQDEVDQAKFELRKRESPSAKRQGLDDKLVSIEEAIVKKRLVYETVAERIAINTGNKYINISMVEETYKENIKILQKKSEEDKTRLRQQISVQATQYEKELEKLRMLLKTQSTSTEVLNVTHEGQLKRLQSEKDTISKSFSSLKSSLESLKNERNELETNVNDLKLELSQELNRNQHLLDSEKTRVNSNSRQQTELTIQLKTAEDGCRRRDDMIKELKGEISTLQGDIEVLQEAKKKLSTQAELFALTEEKGKHKLDLQMSTYEIEIENLKHQVAHKEEVLMNAQELNVSLQETLRHTREEVKALRDKLELSNTSSSKKNDSLENEINRLKNSISGNENKMQEITDNYDDIINNTELELKGVKNKLIESENVKKQIENETKNLTLSLENLQKERDEVDVYNNDLLSRMSQMECENKQLIESWNEHKGRSGRRNMELECKISELKDELSIVYNENQLLKEDIDNKRGETSNILELNVKNKSELELTLSQLTQKSKELEDLQVKFSHKERDLIGLKSKLESGNKEAIITSSEVAKLSQKLAEKSDELFSFQEQAMHERRLVENKIHQLETTIVTSKTENKKTIEFLEISKSALASQVEVLNLEIDALRRDTGDQTNQLKGMTSDSDKLKLELNRVINSLEIEQKEHKQLRRSQTQLELELSDIKSELKSVLSQLISSKQSADDLEQTLSKRERELSEMGTLLNNRQQELDHIKMSETILDKEKDKSDEKAFKLELKLNDLTDTYNQLETDHHLILASHEKTADLAKQYNECKKLYSDANIENCVLKKECHLLREALDHFKGNDRQQLTQLSTFQQSIADAKSALKSERAKTVREHEKCKKWQSEYKTMQSTCDTMHGDIVNLLGKLSSAEGELESSNKRMEERKKQSISKLEGSLEKISEEKGRCEKSVTSLEDKITHLQATLEKERQWKETADELHQTILKDKLELQTKFSEIETELNEKTLSIKMRDLNIKKLQKENQILETKYKEVLDCGQKMWHYSATSSKSVEA